MPEQKTYTSGFGFSSTHFRTASSVALIGAFMSIIGRGCRGRSGEYSNTGRFPLSFAWISGGGSDELPGLSAARGISSPTSASPPSTFTSTASRSCLCSPSPYSLATALTSSQPCLGFCSRGSGWGGTSACGIDGPASLGGAFPSSKAISMCPNPKPPDFISACSLFDSSLNVQDRKAGIISWIVCDVLMDLEVMGVGLPSGIELALKDLVCASDLSQESLLVQLLGSKFSTNHSPNLRGTLYEAHHRCFVLSHPPHSLAPYYHLVLGFELALPVVGQQAAELVLLLARVQSLFWVPLLWISGDLGRSPLRTSPVTIPCHEKGSSSEGGGLACWMGEASGRWVGLANWVSGGLDEIVGKCGKRGRTPKYDGDGEDEVGGSVDTL
nr:hypothetical protein Iba_chr09fCG13330 [Ipomoea batatas]